MLRGSLEQHAASVRYEDLSAVANDLQPWAAAVAVAGSRCDPTRGLVCVCRCHDLRQELPYDLALRVCVPTFHPAPNSRLPRGRGTVTSRAGDCGVRGSQLAIEFPRAGLQGLALSSLRLPQRPGVRAERIGQRQPAFVEPIPTGHVCRALSPRVWLSAREAQEFELLIVVPQPAGRQVPRTREHPGRLLGLRNPQLGMKSWRPLAKNDPDLGAEPVVQLEHRLGIGNGSPSHYHLEGGGAEFLQYASEQVDSTLRDKGNRPMKPGRAGKHRAKRCKRVECLPRRNEQLIRRHLGDCFRNSRVSERPPHTYGHAVELGDSFPSAAACARGGGRCPQQASEPACTLVGVTGRLSTDAVFCARRRRA